MEVQQTNLDGYEKDSEEEKKKKKGEIALNFLMGVNILALLITFLLVAIFTFKMLNLLH